MSAQFYYHDLCQGSVDQKAQMPWEEAVDMEKTVHIACDQAANAKNRTSFARIWEQAKASIESSRFLTQERKEILQPKALAKISTFSRIAENYFKALRGSCHAPSGSGEQISELVPLREYFQQAASSQEDALDPIEERRLEARPLYALSPKQLIQSLPTYLERLCEKLSLFGKKEEEVYTIETFFTRSTDNYKHLDWFLTLPDEDFLAVVTMIQDGRDDFSIEYLRLMYQGPRSIQQIFLTGVQIPLNQSHDCIDTMKALYESVRRDFRSFFFGDFGSESFFHELDKLKRSLESNFYQYIESGSKRLIEFRIQESASLKELVTQFLELIALVNKVCPDKLPVAVTPSGGQTQLDIDEEMISHENFYNFVSSSHGDEKRLAQSCASMCEILRNTPSVPQQELSRIFGLALNFLKQVHGASDGATLKIAPKYLGEMIESLQTVCENFLHVFRYFSEDQSGRELFLRVKADLLNKHEQILKDVLALGGRVREEIHNLKMKSQEEQDLTPREMELRDLKLQVMQHIYRTQYVVNVENALEGVPLFLEAVLSGNLSTSRPEDYPWFWSMSSNDLRRAVLASIDHGKKMVESLGFHQGDFDKFFLTCASVEKVTAEDIVWFWSLPEKWIVPLAKMIVDPAKSLIRFSLNLFRCFCERGGDPELFFRCLESGCSRSVYFRFSVEYMPLKAITQEWFSLFADMDYSSKREALFRHIRALVPLGYSPEWIRILSHNQSHWNIFDQLSPIELEWNSFRRVFSILAGWRIPVYLGAKEVDDVLSYENFINPLSIDQQLMLIDHLDPQQLSPKVVYCLEKADRLKEFIPRLHSLQHLPIEPLIRFVSRMSATEACAWFNEIPESSAEKCRRADTLSADQKIVMLRRFRTHNGLYSQEQWATLFGVSEEESGKLCVVPLLPPHPSIEEFHERLQQIIDPYDPLSLLNALESTERLRGLGNGIEFFMNVVVTLLRMAKEVSICGARSFLIWGNVEPAKSLCCAQDAQLLRVREGKVEKLLPARGIFGNSAPVSLRRRLLAVVPDYATDAEDCLTAIEEIDLELYFEIERVASDLKQSYVVSHFLGFPSSDDSSSASESSSSSQSSTSSGRSPDLSSEEVHIEQLSRAPSRGSEEETEPPEEVPTRAILPEVQWLFDGIVAAAAARPMTEQLQPKEVFSKDSLETIEGLAGVLQAKYTRFQESPEWEASNTLLSLLSYLYRWLSRDELLSTQYDRQKRSHSAAFALVSLLYVGRYSAVRSVEDPKNPKLEIIMTPNVKYLISYVNPEGYVELQEDNQWIPKESFLEHVAEYAPFSLTPVTPNKNFPPKLITSLLHDIQGLEELQFFTLCAKVFESVRSMDGSAEADRLLEESDFVDAVHGSWPEGSTMSEESRMILTELLRNYLPFVQESIRPLEPNKKYFFNIRGVSQFTDIDQVPSFLRSEGNFASAICSSFIPIEPRSHDGNCGVEAILLALHGKDAYSKDVPESADRLKADIKEYRGKITQYATENKDRLCGEFGDRDVERFLQKFSNKDQDEWTSDIALFCASKVYGRPIVVYSRAGTTFATDDRGQLKPSGRFPKGEVAAAGAVISLVFWDNAHYALLEGKESTSPST